MYTMLYLLCMITIKYINKCIIWQSLQCANRNISRFTTYIKSIAETHRVKSNITDYLKLSSSIPKKKSAFCMKTSYYMNK